MGKLRTVVIKRSTLVWRNSMRNIRRGDISQQPNDIASAIRVSYSKRSFGKAPN